MPGYQCIVSYVINTSSLRGLLVDDHVARHMVHQCNNQGGAWRGWLWPILFIHGGSLNVPIIWCDCHAKRTATLASRHPLMTRMTQMILYHICLGVCEQITWWRAPRFHWLRRRRMIWVDSIWFARPMRGQRLQKLIIQAFYLPLPSEPVPTLLIQHLTRHFGPFSRPPGAS